MTKQINDVASTLPGPLRSSLSNLLDQTKSLTKAIIPPKTRESLQKFTENRPILSSFLATQLTFSFTPLLLFAILAITVVIFALVTGLLVGLVGAVVFIVFTLGTALLVLLPTLFVTTFVGVTVWGWGVVGWFVFKLFSERRVPGVHRPLIQGIKEELGLAGVKSGNADTGAKPESENETTGEDESSREENLENNGSQEKRNGGVTLTNAEPDTDTSGKDKNVESKTNEEKKLNGSVTKAEHTDASVSGKETHTPEKKEKKVKLRKKPSKLHEKPEKVDEKVTDKFEDREISNTTDTMGGVGKGVAGLKS